jgi:tRNA 2-thiocytidine biosynthesis protein TtcA
MQLDTATAPDASHDDAHPLFRDAPGSVAFGKLRKRLVREVRETLAVYGMVRPGARWLVCLSGGKDSYTLLAILLDLKWRGLLPVDLLACNLDQAQPGFPAEILPDFLTRHGIPHRIERRDTYSVVMRTIPEGRTYCSLCSRLRRGNLYRIAREEGCEAVVLGHHREDALETFLMNFLHGGRLAAMPPKLLNDEGDLLVLRPLAGSAESDIARFAEALSFPIIPCDLCGSQEGLERARVKALLAEWETARPGTKQVMARALANARPSHLLDPGLFDFAALVPTAQCEGTEVPNSFQPSPAATTTSAASDSTMKPSPSGVAVPS